MIIYTKERGNKDEIKLNKKDRTVEFKNGEYLVSVSIAIYTEQDEKFIINKYNDYKRIFKSDLTTLYRQKRFEGIKYFIRKVLNNRNFVFSITNKHYVLAKILYFTLMTKQSYLFKPGYSLSLISDLSKMKDDLTYPLLFTCKHLSEANFKELLKVVINCPCYYLNDFHNILKKDVYQIYWKGYYEKEMQEIDKYNLSDNEMLDQYITGFDFSNVVERFTSGLKNNSLIDVKIIHDNTYIHHKDVKFHLNFSNANVVYVDPKDSPYLHLVDELSHMFLMLINDCFDIVNNNRPYNNECFNLLSYILNCVYQENFEFQIPTSSWSTIVGIMDLCNESVSDYYKLNHVVDNVISYHHTRVNEYLKNHFDDKRAFSVFKNRV